MTQNVSKIFSAISHPNRVKIIKELEKEHTLCACEIQPKLKLEQSNLSRHLSLLVKSGVLVSWKDGVRVNYKVKDPRIFQIVKLAENIAVEKMDVTVST